VSSPLAIVVHWTDEETHEVVPASLSKDEEQLAIFLALQAKHKVGIADYAGTWESGKCRCPFCGMKLDWRDIPFGAVFRT